MLQYIFPKKQTNYDLINKIDFNSLSSLLTSTKIIPHSFSNTQKHSIEFPNLDIQMKHINQNFSFQTVEKLNIKSNFIESDININNLYNLYNKEKISDEVELYNIEEFTMIMKVFLLIITNFNEDIFHFNFNEENLFKGKNMIKMFTYVNTPINEKFSSLIDKLYEIYMKMEELLIGINLKNVFFIINIFTLFGNISYSELNVDNLLNTIDIFSKVNFSNIKITLLIYLHLAILANYLKNQTKGNHSVIMKPSLPKNVIIPTFYYIENTMQNDVNEISMNIYLGNIIKLYIIPYLIQFVDLEINLKVITLNDIINQMSNINSENIQFDLNSFNSVINFEQVIYIVENFLRVNTLYFKVSPNSTLIQIENKLKFFNKIILSSKNVFADVIQSQKIPIDNIDNELEILNFVLNYIALIKTTKNKKENQYNFNFNFNFMFTSFSIIYHKTIIQSKKQNTKDIMLFISQKNYDELQLLQYIAQPDKMNNFYLKLIKIFKNFSYFKNYSIGIRLTQFEIENKELQFYLDLLYLQMQNFLNDNIFLYKNVVLYESEMISPKYTLLLNYELKLKNKLSYFENYFNNLNSDNMKFLSLFYDELNEYFGKIIIHNDINKKLPFNPYILLRYFKENIFIIIENDNNNINILIYLNNEYIWSQYYEQIIEMIKKIKTTTLNNINLNCNISIIMHRNDFISDHYNLFINTLNNSYVNNIFLIDIDKEVDLILKERKIIIHHRGKVRDYYIDCINDLYIYFDVIRYMVLIYKEENCNNLSFVFTNIIINFKNSNFIIKNITLNNQPFESLLNINVFLPEFSYPLMLLISNKEANNIFSIENIIIIYEKNLLHLKNVSSDIIRKFIISNFLIKSINYITPVVFTEKYIDNISKFLNDCKQLKFQNCIYFPITLIKQPVLSKYFNIAHKITMFQFTKGKINFSSINDVGCALTLQKFQFTMNQLITNPTTKRFIAPAGKRACNINLFSSCIASIVTYLHKDLNYPKIYIKPVCLGILKYLDFRTKEKIEGVVEEYIVKFELIAQEVWKRKKKKKLIIDNIGKHCSSTSDYSYIPFSAGDVEIKVNNLIGITNPTHINSKHTQETKNFSREDIINQKCGIF